MSDQPLPHNQLTEKTADRSALDTAPPTVPLTDGGVFTITGSIRY